jgi:hypothetical protein
MSEAFHARDHKSVIVQVGEFKAEIDEQIAPIIREIWSAGLRTMMSCQETDPGIAWIESEEINDLQRFLNIVATFEMSADTIYDRAVSHLCVPPQEGLWEYDVTPHDADGISVEDDQDGRLVDFYFSAGVYLPQSDLPSILVRLIEHNRVSAQKASLEAEHRR